MLSFILGCLFVALLSGFGALAVSIIIELVIEGARDMIVRD